MRESAGAPRRGLWLVGNSRYGTIGAFRRPAKTRLWLVGNSRYGTIIERPSSRELRYGL